MKTSGTIQKPLANQVFLRAGASRSPYERDYAGSGYWGDGAANNIKQEALNNSQQPQQINQIVNVHTPAAQPAAAPAPEIKKKKLVLDEAAMTTRLRKLDQLYKASVAVVARSERICRQILSCWFVVAMCGKSFDVWRGRTFCEVLRGRGEVVWGHG